MTPEQSGASVAPARASPDLRCPVCCDSITVLMAYTGGPYSEHRDLTGYECDNWRCGAEWDDQGRNTTPSSLVPSADSRPGS